jgi:hypothetical protein
MISSEQVHLLISKYRSEQTLLRITFILRSMAINIRLTARALESEEGFGQPTFVADNGDHCLVVLEGCLFEYGEPREVKTLRCALEPRLHLLAPYV